ncbi:MAG TPA: T9SS type A sorting domain-containing protein, partial [Cytophagales bacterium]
DLPSVKAIEVVPVTAGRLAATGSEGFGTVAVLRPNPAADRVRVQLDAAAGAVQRLTVTDALGIPRLLNGHRPLEGGFELDVRSLRPGAYLLTVTTEGGPRLLRFVKQ